MQQFFLDDIDRDGRPELVLNGIVSNEEIEERNRESVITEEARFLWVLDVGETLTEQLQLPLTEHRDEGKTYWGDINGDGRTDVGSTAG